MKKLLLIIMSLVFILTACGKNENDKETKDKKEDFNNSKYKTSIIYTIQEENPTQEQIQDLIVKLEKRIKIYSMEAEVLLSGEKEITINMATSEASTEIINDIIKPSVIEFLDEKAYENKEKENDYEVLLDGLDIDSATAEVVTNDKEYEYVINLKLTDCATTEFEEITKNNIGKIIYIVYDDEVLLSPYVTSPIVGGEVQVTGIETYEEAELIAAYLSIGQLPLTLELKQ